MSLQANLWKLYIYKFLSEFYLLAPILIPYYTANGLNSTQIFTVQAAYAFSILLFEIPSGYLADVIGRKKTMIIGSMLLPAGIGIYALTGSFGAFLLAEFVIAAANSMRSGCDSALLYDSLLVMEKESQYKKIEGKSFFYTRIGSSLSSVLGGLLALCSLRLPIILNIVTASAMLPFALALTEPERKKLQGSRPLREILRICRFSFNHRSLRTLILAAALIMSTGITGIWAYFLYYKSLDINIGYFGILFAVFQLASAIGSRTSHRIEARWGLRTCLRLLLLIAPVFLLLGLISSLWLFPLILLNGYLWGFSFPLFMNSMNRFIGSEIRATVLSVANMAGSFSFIFLSPAFGKLVDTFSLSTAFIILAGYFMIYASISFRSVFRNLLPDDS